MKIIVTAGLFVMLLSGCADFNKPLGDGYFWLRTNYSNQTIFKDEPNKIPSEKIMIDTRVVDVEVHGKNIIAFREEIDPDEIELELFESIGFIPPSIPPDYGYHIINMENDKVIRALSLSELEALSIEKGFPVTYSMCRNEKSRFECLKRKFAPST